ncbi:MAG: type II toxin-antitoxin system VapC family toxin [Asticcacaulis sp.]|uniref:type II toxin-antitoxin system VapC family toxin n=1 Tax=Asticcacaulis sp. TaxID=1872648 RepID=UPI003F7B46B5
MILADTSIWIAHLRNGQSELALRLERGQILAHPFVLGELMLGGLARRSPVPHLLRNLPQAVCASHDEVLSLIESANLSGCGVGWVDAHLLAACRLTPDALLWTLDRKLHELAHGLGMVL